MKLNGSEIIAECLLEQGVDTVFGYPGGAVLNIYDALYKYSDKITHILSSHEQGAAHAADGYARTTGKCGVVIATSGPGATNLVTGIATAYMDSVPLIAITGNVTNDLLSRDSFQEVDICGISMPITKHNFIVKDVKDLANVIRKAFRIAMSGRKGPVLIDIPKDVTGAIYDFEPVKPEVIENPLVSEKSDFETAAKLIAESKRPMIYMGGGVVSADAEKELLAFAEKIDCPVATSIMGLGGFPSSHRLFMGTIGMHGGYETGKATDTCDLIITVGARFSDRVAGDREKFGKDAKIIQLDIDRAEINKNVKIDTYILGDLKDTLKELTAVVSQTKHDEWTAQVNEWGKNSSVTETPKSDEYAHPYHVIEAVRALTKDSDIIVTDVGQHQMWVSQKYRFEEPRTWCTSGGLGTMGYGLGAAIGSAVAHPDRRIVLFTGDGSFHMNLNELATVRSYDLPITVIVLNNTVLGMVRQWQKLFYGRRFSQTAPHRQTDFAKLAEAFGIKGMRIHNDDDAEEVLAKAFQSKEPVVIDCRISPDENVLPMIPPGKTVDELITEME
ncbi:MAG: biosynthetic-type acetolactate synthase large subunit [Clostridia bacterium]|nr:biosynthetic-type acetolactate synthase large subunit [Clostridia bacterium]